MNNYGCIGWGPRPQIVDPSLIHKEEDITSRSELILDTVEDLVTTLLHYGRKEDEDLPLGAIEEALAAGEITEQDIVERFHSELHEALEGR